MDAAASRELSSIKAELSSIINELSDISSGINSSFKNIGQDKCSDAIDRQIEKLKKARNMLNNIDTENVAEGY